MIHAISITKIYCFKPVGLSFDHVQFDSLKCLYVIHCAVSMSWWSIKIRVSNRPFVSFNDSFDAKYCLNSLTLLQFE